MHKGFFWGICYPKKAAQAGGPEYCFFKII